MSVETISAAKMRRLMIEGLKHKEDRISELPDDILHSILHLLPIKSAAQTVVLSRRWRTVFSSVLDLDFTSVKLPALSDSIINDVLSHRDKTSSIRTLKLESRLASTALKCLLRCAKTNNIQELDMGVCFPYPCADIPWDILINCVSSLKVLRLSRMNLIPGPTQSMNSGFKWLHTITLLNVRTDFSHLFTDSTFPSLKKLSLYKCRTEELDFSCSGLKDLVIRRCCSLHQLDVYGLKLERLEVHTSFTNQHPHNKIKIFAPVIKYLEWVGNCLMHVPVLEKSSSLERAVIGLLHVYTDDHMITPELRSCLFNMMNALSHVKTLRFIYPFTEILKGHYAMSSFVHTFKSLTQLEISSTNNYQGYATLFKNCPNLHTLVISIDYAFGSYWNQLCFQLFKRWGQEPESRDDEYWQDQIPELTSFLNHLKMVKFIWFYEDDKEVCSLAKFLLKHGNVLENLIFCIPNLYDETYVLERIKSIMDLSWISSKVDVELII